MNQLPTSTYGRRVKKTLIIAGAVVVAGLYGGHYFNKKNAVEKETSPLVARVDSLGKEKSKLGTALANEQSRSSQLERISKAAQDSVRYLQSQGIRDKVTLERTIAGTSEELRDYTFVFSRDPEDGTKLYLDIKPLDKSGLTPFEHLKHISRNIATLNRFRYEVPRLVERDDFRLRDYRELDLTKGSDGVWVVTYVNRDGKEGSFKHYGGK